MTPGVKARATVILFGHSSIFIQGVKVVHVVSVHLNF